MITSAGFDQSRSGSSLGNAFPEICSDDITNKKMNTLNRVLFAALSIVLPLVLLLLPLPATAFTCNVTATGLNFGSYDVFSSIPRDTTAIITVTCNAPPQNPRSPVPVTISLSPGGSGSFAQRGMQPLGGGPDWLLYNLYTTPSFSSVWGDGSAGSQTQTNFVTRDAPWTATIYGRASAGQNISVGSYSDVITVTIEW
jgi:spore coat protein U-like protein